MYFHVHVEYKIKVGCKQINIFFFSQHGHAAYEIEEDEK